MNALALWIPGTLLIIVGALLLGFGRLDFEYRARGHRRRRCS